MSRRQTILASLGAIWAAAAIGLWLGQPRDPVIGNWESVRGGKLFSPPTRAVFSAGGTLSLTEWVPGSPFRQVHTVRKWEQRTGELMSTRDKNRRAAQDFHLFLPGQLGKKSMPGYFPIEGDFYWSSDTTFFVLEDEWMLRNDGTILERVSLWQRFQRWVGIS